MPSGLYERKPRLTPEQAAAEKAELSKYTLNRSDVAKKLGVGLTVVRRMQTRGDLSSVLVEGVWKFNLEEVENIAANGVASTDELSSQDLLLAATGLVKQAQDNMQRMFDLLHDPMLEVMRATLSRIEQLEARNMEMLNARETALSQVHDREMDRMRAIAAEQRKDGAVTFFKSQVWPQVGPRIVEKFGGGSLEIASMIASITDEQFGLIVASDMFSAEQISKLAALRAAYKQKENHANNSHDGQSVPGVSTEQDSVS